MNLHVPRATCLYPHTQLPAPPAHPVTCLNKEREGHFNRKGWGRVASTLRHGGVESETLQSSPPVGRTVGGDSTLTRLMTLEGSADFCRGMPFPTALRILIHAEECGNFSLATGSLYFGDNYCRGAAPTRSITLTSFSRHDYSFQLFKLNKSADISIAFNFLNYKQAS